LVAQVGGVDYINDSKATNVHALESSLCAFSRPVVLLVGGKDKGLDYSSLPALLAGRVRHVVAFGEIGEALRERIEGAIEAGVEVVANMNSAVRAARAVAVSGDIVLLSPGTSSFDMFDGYVERGEAFRRAVEGLAADDRGTPND
jgi:UDP-N-acetylmuramoylalanine--D-glutamate ligase